MAHAEDPEPGGEEAGNASTPEGAKAPPITDSNDSKEAPPPPRPERQRLASPGQVDSHIAIDASLQMTDKRFGFLDPYDDWKLRLRDRTGFGFGVDYTAVGLAANEALDDYGAAGGIVRAFANWKVTRFSIS